jgi:hypothetical protein
MPDVKITVEAATAQAQDSINKLDQSLDAMGKTADPAVKNKFDGLWKQIGLGQLAYSAARQAGDLFVDFLKGSFTAAIDAEAAEAALMSAIRSTGKEATLSGANLSKYADELMGVTTQDDEAIKKAQALLIQLTDLNEQGIKEATKGAIGLSTVMGTDLQSAARVVAQAMEGNYTMLGRYIPALKQTKDETEKHNIVMKFMADAYKRATDEAQTTGGLLKKIGNSFGELQEAVGGAIVQNNAFTVGLDLLNKALPTFEAYVKKLIDTLNVMPGPVKNFIQSIMALGIVMATEAAKEKYYQDVARGTIEVAGIMAEKFKAFAPAVDGVVKQFSFLNPLISLFGGHAEAVVPPIKRVGDGLKDAKDKARDLDDVMKSLGLKSIPQVAKETLQLRKDSDLLVAAFKRGDISADTLAAGIKKLYKQMTELETKVVETKLPVNQLGAAMLTMIPATKIDADLGKVTTSWIKNAAVWVSKNKETLETVLAMSQQVVGLIDQAWQNSYQQRLNELDAWYQQRKAALEATYTNEDDLATAMAALDKEYAEKKKRLEKEGAEHRKKMAIIGAIMDTASAVISALQVKPFIPMGLIAAAMAGALGMAQLAIISKQSIPLAGGGILDRPTFSSGGKYVAGEGDDAEIVGPVNLFSKIIAKEIAKALGGQRGGGGGGSIYLDGEKVGRHTIKTMRKAVEINDRRLGIAWQ